MMELQEGTPMFPPLDAVPDPHRACTQLGRILNSIGDKWTIMVIGVLSDGPVRFNELRRTIGGVSQRMLTLTLRDLERDGLLTRTVYPTIPPRVDYELTPLGRTLIEPLRALSEWAVTHQAELAQAQASYDQRPENIRAAGGS
ncbi:winged helix-turn-helix transcriptional regulator [Deinococcus budaensis]|uniref:DNA-binding HxlR family transcriptional regulator n=1 Tax=Deinococcus budaensis TaxID=1665626 RepID=A0A7W8GF82_9DEIO|nr:helix-turn-helix domain-containing protein [Deinococcus budaensis]MBB5234136.1 DNA-binding HxlR family transcriptional regulator [Deinococcus budaensis]